MARPAGYRVSFFFLHELDSLTVGLAVVVHSHGVVVGLPWEVLSGVHVDACCEGRVWQTNVVDKYGCGGSFGRMGGNELVEGARDSCEAVLFDGICHGCWKK